MSTAVRFCGGGVIPLFPKGTIAVCSGLYLRIRKVLPPLRGIFFLMAGIFNLLLCDHLHGG